MEGRSGGEEAGEGSKTGKRMGPEADIDVTGKKRLWADI